MGEWGGERAERGVKVEERVERRGRGEVEDRGGKQIGGEGQGKCRDGRKTSRRGTSVIS